MNRFIVATAACGLVLVRLPVLAGGGIVRLAALLPFAVAIVWMAEQPRRKTRSSAAVLWTLVAVSALSLYRGQQAGVLGSSVQTIIDVLTMALVAGFATLLIATATVKESGPRLAAIALSPAVFIAANLLLRAAGFEAPSIEAGRSALAAGDQAELLRYFGVSALRTQFPLSTGVNSTGAVAAAGMAAALLLVIHARGLVSRRLSIAAALVCFYGVLAIDSRGALLFAAAITGVLAVRPRARLAWLAFLLPFSSVIVLKGLGLASDAGLVAGVARSGEDVTSGNSRLYIWEPIWRFVQHPSLEMVYGYGAKGHVTSGVSEGYAYIFPSSTDRYNYSSHNLALQTLLDSGYLGLAVLMAVLFISLRALRRFGGPLAPALSAIVAVLFLSGTTEALPNALFPDTMVLTIMAAGVGLGYRRNPAVAREPGRRAVESQERGVAERGEGADEAVDRLPARVTLSV